MNPNQFRYRGECTPEYALSIINRLYSDGYNNIRCDQVNSGWFDDNPTYLITAEKHLQKNSAQEVNNVRHF